MLDSYARCRRKNVCGTEQQCGIEDVGRVVQTGVVLDAPSFRKVTGGHDPIVFVDTEQRCTYPPEAGQHYLPESRHADHVTLLGWAVRTSPSLPRRKTVPTPTSCQCQAAQGHQKAGKLPTGGQTGVVEGRYDTTPTAIDINGAAGCPAARVLLQQSVIYRGLSLSARASVEICSVGDRFVCLLPASNLGLHRIDTNLKHAERCVMSDRRIGPFFGYLVLLDFLAVICRDRGVKPRLVFPMFPNLSEASGPAHRDGGDYKLSLFMERPGHYVGVAGYWPRRLNVEV
ncbi:hypothetical protein LZ30DRAFT_767012 [Colletotrichum cereale]|nr:hypothetical protein LZ30DRAFT_767012 [Colletotrichum cereale]